MIGSSNYTIILKTMDTTVLKIPACGGGSPPIGTAKAVVDANVKTAIARTEMRNSFFIGNSPSVPKTAHRDGMHNLGKRAEIPMDIGWSGSRDTPIVGTQAGRPQQFIERGKSLSLPTLDDGQS